MKVLVTGGAGYVGSGVLRALLNRGHQVVCLDKLDFGGDPLIDIWHEPRFQFYNCDIRDSLAVRDTFEKEGIDSVIHLAAIVGDPACKRSPELARETNWEASVNLLEIAKASGVKRFVFASTCSNYGRMSDPSQYVSESAELAPVSLYAELKVQFERHLLEGEKVPGFIPTALRFATVYGVSPRMRFDLTVNEFTKELVSGRELTIFGEQFWRPYCHVRDFANAFLTVLDAPEEKVSHEVFNVGDTQENYTKEMLVKILQEKIPESRIRYVTKQEDPRDYRVNCDKIKQELGFQVTVTVPEGIQEIIELLQAGVIANTEDQRYYNIPINTN